MSLGRAFIEVHADTRPFAKELGPQVKRIVEGVEKTVDSETAKSIGDSVAKAISSGIERNGEKITESVSRSVQKSRTRVKVDADVDIDRDRLAKTASTVGSAISTGITKSMNLLGDSVNNTADGVQKLIGGLLNVTSVSLPVAVILIALAGILVPMLLSAIVVVSAALANLIGLVPIFISGLGVLLAAVFPIVAAFQGFGEAMSAVFEKDPEKLAEAMKKLTPAAREVVNELRLLLPFFTKLREVAQQAFFGQLTGVLTTVVKAVQGPLLAGFQAVATAAGKFAAAILSIGASAGFSRHVSMFQGAVTLFQTLQGPMVTLLRALMAMAVAALPFFIQVIQGLGDFLTRFSGWIQQNIADGSFQAFLDQAMLTMTDLKNLLGAVVELFAVMFAETEEGGRTFLQTLTLAIQRLTEFFRSPDGKRALKAMVDLAIIFGVWLNAAAGFAIYLLNQLHRVAEIMKWILKNINGIDISRITPRSAASGAIGRVGTAFAEGGSSTANHGVMGEGTVGRRSSH